MNRRVLRLSTTLMERVLGRRNVVRLSRALLNQARRDGLNEIDINGELVVQGWAASRRQEQVTVFDVGANVGQWSTRLVANAIRPVDLHVFEPSPACLPVLRSRLRTTDIVRVTIVPAAVSSIAGTAVLYQPHQLAGSSSLHELPIPLGETAVEDDVQTITLDTYCANSGISDIDLLKVDAEGHDFHVLLGAEQLLQRRAICAVQFEYNHRWMGARKYLRDVFGLAREFGYSLGKVTPDGIEWYPEWRPELETLIEGNYLMVRSDCVGEFPSIRWWGIGTPRRTT